MPREGIVTTIVPGEPAAEAAAPRPEKRPSSLQISGIFLILLIGVLYYARDFFLPMAIALLVYLTLSPLVRWLSRRGIPAALSAVLLVTSVAAGIFAIVLVIADPVMEAVAHVPQTAEALKEKFQSLRRPLEALVRAGSEIEEMTDTTTGAGQPREVVLSQPGIVSIAAGTAAGLLTTAGATLILIIFLLSSGDLFLQKIVRVVPRFSDKKKSLRIVKDVEAEVSRYLLTITIINMGLGTAVGLAMAALGMPNPVLWGVASAVLNFIPYVGAVIATASAAIVAAAVYAQPFEIILPPITYLALHTLESAFITPLILGRRLELNAVAIFVALAFWSWMWGIVGALIAVPLLVIIKVFCDHFEKLSVIGEFLSGVPPAIETATVPNGISAEPELKEQTPRPAVMS